MKIKAILLSLVIATSLFAGCSQKAVSTPSASAAPKVTQSAAPSATPKADTATSASVVDNAAAFEKAISKNGTWIIATLKDLKFDKDLLLEGEFKNGKKDAAGKELIQRKIGLYTQDEKRNVTARFTLTAPKLTITSPEASLEHGTFKGDLYVSVNNFKLIDQIVDGNVYFTTDEAKSTFKMDDKSKISGKQELKK